MPGPNIRNITKDSINCYGTNYIAIILLWLKMKFESIAMLSPMLFPF